MRILVLGGTQFVGKHIVHEATRRGHAVTTFTRGKTPEEDLAGVERLHGDRDGNLTALQSGTWDAVIDVSGYVPRVVRQSAELLRDATKRYLFISTVSVYADRARTGTTEDDALEELADPTTEKVMEAYGGLKVLCERVVQNVYAERATIVRPGLIVGPHDHTDRFTFWAWHLAQGGTFPMIGTPDAPFQVIDARDLAAFTVHLLEQDLGGVYNAVGERLTWGDVVSAVRDATGDSAEPAWRGDDAMEASGVRLPLAGSLWSATLTTSDERAVAAGLTRRPLADTVRDLLAWVRDTNRELNTFGLTPEKQHELLAHG